MAKKIYLDTSVFGGIFDPEFTKYSTRLFYEFEHGLYVPVISRITLDELENAPIQVFKAYQNIEDQIGILEVNKEAYNLSRAYLKEGKFSTKMLADTLHIAIASIYKIDILVSWNFKDIVNLNKIAVYNAVNLKTGYPLIEIRNPREVIHE